VVSGTNHRWQPVFDAVDTVIGNSVSLKVVHPSSSLVCATPDLKSKAEAAGVEPQETDARTAANADAAL